jgi:hypothetical protein
VQRITSTAFDDLADPLALDMIAAFSLIQEDTEKLVAQAEKEGWDSDTLIQKIDELLSGDGNGETDQE